MNDFVLHNTVKVFFGKEFLKPYISEMRKYGNKALLVYGSGSVKKNGIYEIVVNECISQGIEVKDLQGIEPNPRLKSVIKGVNICKEEKIDFIIALGGGSVMDASKAIAIGACYDKNVWDFFSYKETPKAALPVGTIPTLAATGSEMNSGAVISNMETTEKNGYGHELMYPKATWMNPEFTYSVSKYHTAAGVADILAHLIEFYFHHQTDTLLQDSLQESIMKSVIEYGPIAIKEPNNYDARSNLMWASSLALNGFISCGLPFDGFNHTFEHVISAHYDITHGVGLALIMPKWLEYILSDKTVSRIAKFGRNVMGIIEKNDLNAARKGIKKLQEYFNSLGLPKSFAELNINDSKFRIMAKDGLHNGSIGRFKSLNEEDLYNILVMCK